jgi:hypothetical protein
VGVCVVAQKERGRVLLERRSGGNGVAAAAEEEEEEEEEGEVELEVSVAMRRSGLTRDGRGDCYLLSLAVLFLVRTACAQCNPASLQHVHANFDVADLSCESSGFHAEAWVCMSSSLFPLLPLSLPPFSLSLSHTHTHTHTHILHSSLDSNLELWEYSN